MFSSLAPPWVLTAAFALSGVFALLRITVPSVVAARGCDGLTELSHLLMSVAMVAMVWSWSGGPETLSGILQLVVFCLFAVRFLVLIPGAGTGLGRFERACHPLMAAAMVWMVAAMPFLMNPAAAMSPTTVGDPTTAMGAMPGMGSTWNSSVPGAPAAHHHGGAQLISAGLAIVLGAYAVYWAARWVLELRRAAVRLSEPGVHSRPALARLVALVAGPGVGAFCHAAMSLGMVAMLVVAL